MALIPTWYSASTKQIAEKALQRGVLKYPGLCYIQDSKSIAWVTIDNTLEYVKGDKQINHKEILPYASNKLFPSVGDINTIYIDTATNTIYRWDSSSKTYVTLAKAVKSVVISEATENGKITLTVDGNKTTVPIHGLGSAAYTNSSAYSPAGHTHTKAQVGLGNVDNTADANKSVKHATTANSATTAGTATNVSAGEGTADAARHVWFSDSATETKRAYSDKFKYNPVTNNLTVNVTGNAATASSVAWGNVTGKPSTFTPASHTHNYAGSSSAGGNANAAVKLATARKIGNASFDGTANITLSQMGLNIPVEITKADYLAKKKAGTLNANTYYNVIDEYDSANVINDSSVTANSAFSSTKSEKTYAKKSAIINTTLTASKWTGSSAPYTYVLPVSGATTSNIVEINYASNASSQAIEAYQNAMLADGGQTTNQITIKATEKPTVDIPITIVIRNDL